MIANISTQLATRAQKTPTATQPLHRPLDRIHARAPVHVAASATPSSGTRCGTPSRIANRLRHRPHTNSPARSSSPPRQCAAGQTSSSINSCAIISEYLKTQRDAAGGMRYIRRAAARNQSHAPARRRDRNRTIPASIRSATRRPAGIPTDFPNSLARTTEPDGKRAARIDDESTKRKA